MSQTHRFGLGSRRSAARGAASIFFAIVFVFVGIVHAASHNGVPLSGSQPQISANLDNTDDGAATDAIGICHCAYCVGFVFPSEFNSTLVTTVKATFELTPLACLSPHDPTFQTPPPKSSI